MIQLFVIAAGVGVVTVFFDVANQSYLPEIVAGDQIGDGNGKLQASQQTASVVGPSAASGLVGLIGGPLTIGITSICMALSSLFVSRIRHREDPPQPDSRPSLVATSAKASPSSSATRCCAGSSRARVCRTSPRPRSSHSSSSTPCARSTSTSSSSGWSCPSAPSAASSGR